MLLPGGVYAAALDADTDHHEGLTYVWTPAQVREILGESDGHRFCSAYCITDDGTFEEGTSQPALGESDFDERRKLAPLREKLLSARRISQHARRIIQQNIFISLGSVIVMAIASLFGIVPLSLGVLTHEGSTVLVCLNSLRLLFEKE